MKRTLILTFALIIYCFNAWSQQLKGIVCDAKGQAVENANVFLTTLDSVSCITNNKGEFRLTLPKGKHENISLAITHMSYSPIVLNIGNVSSNTDLGTLKLKESAQKIDEVVVTADNINKMADRKFYYPSEKIRNNSNNAFDLFYRMMLPNMYVNPVTKSISTISKESVLVYINDRKASKTDLMSLRPKDILSIEHVEVPGAEYGFDTAVGAVILVHARTHDNGYIVGIDAGRGITTDWQELFGYGKYYKGKSEFRADVQSNYRNLYRRNTSNYNEYSFSDNKIIVDRQGLNTKLRYDQNNVELGYNFTNPQKQIFDISLMTNLYESPYRGNRQTVTETGKSPYHSFTENTEHYFSPVANVFYKHYFKNKSSLTSNVVFTMYDTEYGYSQIDCADESLTDTLAHYRTFSKGNRSSLIAESRYAGKMKRFSYSTGVRYYHGYTKNNSEGYETAENIMRNDNLYAFAQISGKIKKLSYVAGMGISYLHTKQGDAKTENWVLRPRLTLTYQAGDVAFNYTFRVSPGSPSLSMMTSVMQRLNEYEFTTGNPELKSYYNMTNRLTTTYAKGNVTVQNILQHRYSHNPIGTEYTIFSTGEANAFLAKSINQKSFHNIYDQLSTSWFAIPDVLSLRFNLMYNHYASHGIDYNHYLNTLKASVQADVMLGKWNIGGSWNSDEKQLSGETITKKNASSTMYVYYQLKNVRLGVVGMNLFSRDGAVMVDHLISKNIQQKTTVKVPSMGNLLFLSLSWNLQKGKIHKTTQNDFENKDTDTGY